MENFNRTTSWNAPATTIASGLAQGIQYAMGRQQQRDSAANALALEKLKQQAWLQRLREQDQRQQELKQFMMDQNRAKEEEATKRFMKQQEVQDAHNKAMEKYQQQMAKAANTRAAREGGSGGDDTLKNLLAYLKQVSPRPVYNPNSGQWSYSEGDPEAYQHTNEAIRGHLQEKTGYSMFPPPQMQLPQDNTPQEWNQFGNPNMYPMVPTGGNANVSPSKKQQQPAKESWKDFYQGK